MKLSDAIKQRIINLAKSNNITLHKLSLNAGLAYSTLSSFLNGKSTSPKLVTILHICEGLNIELKDFFDDELFENVEED
ncbi:MAG: helix-turn-helix transcriptional regulator [Clostridia bacterium]|nr:helix-turn-helix transcriptional regulator [Clostridia bacterium]